ncbi:MAG: aminoacyl-tRNA hydrolase [Bacteroidales bacterium]|nr:aminoacyl-tRNA hydrolase [Bacteroidales bacterium]
MSDHSQNALANRPFNKEYEFLTSRSSGPGGQHVNKTETKVELRFHVEGSQLLSETEKQRIKEKLKHKINSEGFLQVFAQEYRSQIKNKELAEKRFLQYLLKALAVRKKRIPVKPSKAMIEKRIKTKKINTERKTNRTKIRPNDVL